MKSIKEILLGAAIFIGLTAPVLAVPNRSPHSTSPHVYNHERQSSHYYGGFFHPDRGWHRGEHEHGDWGFHHGWHRDWNWEHRHWYGGKRYGHYFGPVYHPTTKLKNPVHY